ncbi:peptidoglycan-binding protein [Acetobacter sp. DsW_063]|uniref:glycoside hydrolase family 19 protein n=1 Tax=Acetobacter sp. DsW_063 TaxID=1514894 RepID=UPI0011776E29|nr:peptidoglycan-binding protein [Acetobacter sp. DsW_063]
MYLDPTLDSWGVDTRLRKAHFLGQTSVESWDFCDLEEEASGSAYEGRRDLGNTQPGDGERYKGRGLIQVTGRYNYGQTSGRVKAYDIQRRSAEQFKDNRGPLCVLPDVDFVGRPKDLATLPMAITASCAFWKRYNLNRYADADNSFAVTYLINTVGDQKVKRKQRTEDAKRLLLEPEAREIKGAFQSATLSGSRS